MLALIADAATAGHECCLLLDDEPDLRINWSARGSIGVEGSSNFLADPNDRNALTRHIEGNAVDDVVGLLAGWRFTLTVSLKYARGGIGWIHDLDKLVESLSSSRWWSTLSQLTKVTSAGRATFVVDGLHPGERIDTPMFCFVPPDDMASRSSDGLPAQPGHIGQGRIDMPTPSALLPVDDESSLALSAALVGSSNAIAWVSLASAKEIATSSIEVLYQGVRDVRMDLTCPPSATYEQALSALRLWEWCSAGQDVMRFDAVQRAITLAATTADDLAEAAEAVLRTSRTLYEVAARGVIAEALSARRSGREAAANAARTAAAAGREAATKATERSLGMMAAAAGVVFATLSKVLDWRVAVAALVILIFFLVGASVIALCIDFRSATDGLEAFDSDLNAYRETLGSDDIASLKRLEVLKMAKRVVARSVVAAMAVYWISTVLAALFVGILIWTNWSELTPR